MLVKKLKILPIECIVRGYISGSSWKSYVKSGEICGLPQSVIEMTQSKYRACFEKITGKKLEY